VRRLRVRTGDAMNEGVEHDNLEQCADEGKRTCGVVKNVGRAEEWLSALVAREAALLLLGRPSYRGKVVGRQLSALCSAPRKNQRLRRHRSTSTQ
jgi:hypothetical protein